MCSGCMTWGNSTMFGKGNSRTVPMKSARGENASLIEFPLSRFFFQKILGSGPGFRRRIQGNLGNQFFPDLDGLIQSWCRGNLGKALIHLLPEGILVQPQKRSTVTQHVVFAAAIKFECPA